MKDLIEALTIFEKYMKKVGFPTHCEHDILYVLAPKEVLEEDAKELKRLGFFWSDDMNSWKSFRFGSA